MSSLRYCVTTRFVPKKGRRYIPFTGVLKVCILRTLGGPPNFSEVAHTQFTTLPSLPSLPFPF